MHASTRSGVLPESGTLFGPAVTHAGSVVVTRTRRVAYAGAITIAAMHELFTGVPNMALLEIAALFPIVNPVGTAPIFLSRRAAPQRRRGRRWRARLR